MTSSVSRRRLLTYAGPAAAAVALAGCGIGRRVLVCRHQRTGEVYAELPITAESEITHSWIHSIELSRWTDVYRVHGEGLLLVATSFQEYGAGMPLDEGDVSLRDGRVVIENIDRPFEAIRWMHSHRVDYRIGVDGHDDLIDTLRLPDKEPLELRPQ
ncbi:DUF1850 domain-containing protein [Sediminivirga luteola]|uniref:DUF1850 domain-containing protein n=1 Tax=Sediminivirga luteola TaxID=1774748 RepID=A0A8J2TWP4_9MICO|nr:DUF1850 domain-containing protein [Sediminivirga luteola]MCI2263926.1 DUF1850 domain-containing protein [Sediminivirga luteola]GGA08742.1 hypothetical protein GCM10011333_09620 [Sediminivirga luteola]